jgi:glycosyltransferase involved in cell wall biosynthesis
MAALRLIIVTPVFNDWESFGELLRHIDALVCDRVCELEIVAVDDCSTEPIPDGLADRLKLQQVRSICVVKLKLNLGHQGAIAVGLAQATQIKADGVLIMDADGEDRPRDMLRLIEQHTVQPGHIIVASRTQRSEGFLFRVCYCLYKGLFRLLTGEDISFGNFSLIPMALLMRLVRFPSMWTHFAATLQRSRLPLLRVPVTRGRRYAGKSKMNFFNLVVHGLSAISVFSEAMLARALLLFVFATSIGALAILIIVALRLFTDFGTPGWATLIVGSIAIVCLQGLLLIMIAAFLALANRSIFLLPPEEHAQVFIDHIVTLFPRNVMSKARTTA